ncbi:tRNA lysidine(34) synthetase TilS [Shimwellia pseudoproteus]|uniref:tRNA lysidine(34) synthetase TilS n=1 Tax=Shimwellia pseudoproteus TaxID=570012 RepID=UPI0018EC4422|nr:tRNA lysidine(34) synthetase TilS [Shimwellia pseudoproteus]MBJ3813356.1 tRNA lysidine(34) synthetase TilS [Shimwellia pseudoproteus]
MKPLITPSDLVPALRGHRQILVALSGGLDSSVLLHLLCQLRADTGIALRALYVHHGISRFADDWLHHCQALCDGCQVPFIARKVQLTDSGKGTEAEAREKRYQALADALAPGEALATAQHMDDQCETLMLALKRGSGPAGLAAMPGVLPFHHSVILRPLLGFSRQQLEAYARYHGLSWIDDDSNADDSYDRNFLRLRILPLLRQRWPYFARSVARSAALCGEQEALLDELLAEQLQALVGPGGELALATLTTMSDARRGALLRRWFAYHGAVMPARAALQRLWDEVALSREDASPRLRFGEYEVRRYRDALWWVPCYTSQRDTVIAWASPFAPLSLPEGLGVLHFSADGSRVRPPRADEPVSVRFRASGNVHIVGREHGRTMKKIWQELGVAPWQRDTTPLLFYGEQLIAAPGIFVTRDGQGTAEDSWHLGWLR